MLSPEVIGLILDACDVRALEKQRVASRVFHDLVVPPIFPRRVVGNV